MSKKQTWTKAKDCGHGCCNRGLSKVQISRGNRRTQKQQWKKEI